MLDMWMHASWNCVASFGRFVEIGKRELIDAGRLDMSIFLRNTTFTAFDLSDLFYHDSKTHRDILSNTMKEVLEMYRAGEIQPVPITTFDASDMVQAYRYFSLKDRVGKVVISLENQSSRIPVAPPKYLTIFDPEKAYVLIGCLGGLGRSLSDWMLGRGARHFVFLGRTGCDKPSAHELVFRLRDAGANVTVVRGDVSDIDAVNATIAACEHKPIGGVVQAAMGLHEALLLRRGIQPLNEDEFLQIIDLAIVQEKGASYKGTSHILTGLEPFRVRELKTQGFDVSHGTLQDPRASIIATAFRGPHDDSKSNIQIQIADIQWLKEAPASVVSVAAILVAEMDAPSLHDAVLRVTRKQFSNLILMPLERIENGKPLLDFGIDSMIAAEFRTWVWTAFKVDIPFLDILSPHKSLGMLSNFIAAELEKGRA
ncbi:KR domain-containing protein [Daldinia decipiens]|uniref:KR domain-containing protein n=1 Tax=Daldinia decipiens TaxID=326647 RepID=UPI0020C336D4|nr:KR domain-containing protein [Daldinia decipiens]KAI1658690.1 KR domain-containing protein [Daldinia decipiens]